MSRRNVKDVSRQGHVEQSCQAWCQLSEAASTDVYGQISQSIENMHAAPL